MEKELEDKLAELDLEIARLKAVQQIQNCMGQYESFHNPMCMGRTPECFALSMPDCSMEVSDWGKFVGAEAITYQFAKMMSAPKKEGRQFVHVLGTPIIEVAGDSKTAKAVWWSPGFETPLDRNGEPVPYWCWGMYSADFIVENGQWKIWHLKWWRVIRNNYYKSWVEDWPNMMTGKPNTIPEGLNIQPITFFHPYDTKTARHPFPQPPKPYKTYEDSDPEWYFGDYKDEYFSKHTATSEFEYAHGIKAGETSNNDAAQFNDRVKNNQNMKGMGV